MPTSEFVVFADDPGANAITPAALASHALRPTGHLPGVALSEVENAVLRQTSTAAAGLAALMAQYGASNVLDNANATTFKDLLKAALDAIIESHQGWSAGDIKLASDQYMLNHPGWTKANGAIVPRIGTYGRLWTLYGTTFGAGDGTTTFQLPDWRGEFFRAWDDGRGVDPGRSFLGWQVDTFKSHFHEIGTEAGGGGNFATPVDSPGTDELPGGNTTSAVGGAETRPRNVALMVLIRL